MRRWGIMVVATAATVAVLYAVTLNGSLQVLGTLTASIVDFTGSASTAPMKSGTALPPACSVGQAFFKTDAAAGQNIHLCTAANTWTQIQGSSGGSGSFTWKPSSRYVSLKTDFNQLEWSNGSPAHAGDFRFIRSAGTQNLNNPTGGYAPADRGGFMTVSTTTTSGNFSSWFAALANNVSVTADGLYARTNLDWELIVFFRFPDAADHSNVDALVGLHNATGSNPPAGLGVGASTSAGGNFSFISTGNGVIESTLSTGVPLDSGTWHRLRIRSDRTSQYRLWLSFDNGAEVSVCPSGCTLTRSTSASEQWSGNVGVWIRTNDAAQKRIMLDYVSFWLDRGIER